MSLLTQDIAQTLKAARLHKGLSQRDLSQRVNMPQSYLSRIENGSVDIGLSNLIALSRALDLEIKLVPKHATPAVDSVVRSAREPGIATAAPPRLGRTRPPPDNTLFRPMMLGIPKIELPRIELPKIEIPKIEIPTFKIPTIEMPKITIPTFKPLTAPQRLHDLDEDTDD